MQESSSFGIGTSGQSKGRFLPVLEDQQGVGYLHRVISSSRCCQVAPAHPRARKAPAVASRLKQPSVVVSL